MRKFIILLVVVVGVAAYSYTVNRNDDKGSEVLVELSNSYSNARHQYTFEYPEEYEVRGFSEAGGDIEVSQDSVAVGVREIGSTEFIFGVSEANMSDITESSIESTFTTTSPEDITVTTTELDGRTASKAVIKGDDVVTDFYYVQNGDKVLSVTVAKNNDNSRAIFESLTWTE